MHEQSHGESFFALFQRRFGGKGLYVLDEPEAALSPSRQLDILRRLHQLVGNQSQFIIATHSPILMAYPDSWIYQLTADAIRRIEYRQTDHSRVARQFLENPTKFFDDLG